MKIQTTKAISQDAQTKRDVHKKRAANEALNAVGDEWRKNNDLAATVEKKQNALRQEVEKLVEQQGNGDSEIVTDKYVFSAKHIVSSPYVDGCVLAKLFDSKFAKYKNYAKVVLVPVTTYEVDEKLLIQLVERGKLPADLLKRSTVPGGDRGTRITVKPVQQTKKNAPVRKKK